MSNASNKLLSLVLFFDNEHKIIRISGRLSHSEFTFATRHTFPHFLFLRKHVNLMHVGRQLLLASIREQYRPLGGCFLARKIVCKCTKRFRYNPSSSNNLIGDRIKPHPPFTATGTCFAGPFLIKHKKGKE